MIDDASSVTIGLSRIGNPGNLGVNGSQDGAVSNVFYMGTTEVTNAQYSEFLNAKAPRPEFYGLYNVEMTQNSFGGIIREGLGTELNPYIYYPKLGRESKPVNFVSWYDAIRFCNWLHNGQGDGSTETGAYTILGGATPTNANSIRRSSTAVWFTPSWNEWIKAGYYNPSSHSFFTYPTSSNTAPHAVAPTPNANSANFNNAVGDLTNVGAYSSSKSPYGVFDMAGNIEERLDYNGQIAGGAFIFEEIYFRIGTRGAGPASGESRSIGFRVASTVPEPTTLALAALGGLGLLIAARR